MKPQLRIIGAIVAKDLVDALKNKQIVSVLVTVLAMLLFYRALPALENMGAVPNLLVYDAGNSTWVVALENSNAVKVYTYSSQERLLYYLANGDVPELGLVIPADFDQTVQAGGTPELQGYVMHWVSAADAEELQQYVAEQLRALTGVPVQIRVAGNIVYSRPDSDGIGVAVSWVLVFTILMVGISLVPHLMLEEKQTKTLEALLVSPATPQQITLAKGLVGLCYGVLGVGIGLALNQAVITQWGWAILATLSGALFTVALGLLLGTLLQTRQQLMLWAWVLIIPLFVPLILASLNHLLPAWVNKALLWNPAVALSNLFRTSFSNQSQFRLYGPGLAQLLVWAGLLLVLVARQVRRLDR